MAAGVNFAIPGAIQPPMANANTATQMDVLHIVTRYGAFVKCAGGVKRSRVPFMHRECKSKYGSDDKRDLCAGHGPASPKVSHYILPRTAKEWAAKGRQFTVCCQSSEI